VLKNIFSLPYFPWVNINWRYYLKEVRAGFGGGGGGGYS